MPQQTPFLVLGFLLLTLFWRLRLLVPFGSWNFVSIDIRLLDLKEVVVTIVVLDDSTPESSEGFSSHKGVTIWFAATLATNGLEV